MGCGVLLLIISLMMISSCTVHKRVHRKGWYVDWNFQKKDGTNSSQKNTLSSTDSKKNESLDSEIAVSVESEEESQEIISIPFSEEDDLNTHGDPNSTESEIDSQSIKANDVPEKSDSETDESNQKNIAAYISLTTLFLALLAGIIIGISTGFTILLIPFWISAITALLTFLSIKAVWKNKAHFDPKGKTRKLLVWMFALIALVFGITILVLNVQFTTITIAIVMLVAFFVLLVSASRGKAKRDKLEELASPNSEDQAPIKEEETIPKVEESIQTERLLSPSQAFPKLTGGILIYLLLVFLCLLILLIISSISVLANVAIGPLFYSVAVIAFLLFVFALIFAVKRQNLYTRYKEEHHINSPAEPTIEKNNSKSINTEKANAIILIITLMAAIVTSMIILI